MYQRTNYAGRFAPCTPLLLVIGREEFINALNPYTNKRLGQATPPDRVLFLMRSAITEARLAMAKMMEKLP